MQSALAKFPAASILQVPLAIYHEVLNNKVFDIIIEKCIESVVDEIEK